MSVCSSSAERDLEIHVLETTTPDDCQSCKYEVPRAQRVYSDNMEHVDVQLFDIFRRTLLS